MNTQVLLDLLTIARNDWISNSLGNKISAADVVDNFRAKEKETSPSQPGRRITLEVLDIKPKLKQVMEAPLSRFFNRYSDPRNLEHLSIKTSIADIVSDPTASTVIEYIQGQFDYIENLIDSMSREENAVRLKDVRTEIEKSYQSIFGYLETVHSLVLKESAESQPRKTEGDLPFINIHLGEKM